jgi:hypothetical protein
VLKPSNARERSPSFAFYGSSHQIMVLTPQRDLLTAERVDSSPPAPEDMPVKVAR